MSYQVVDNYAAGLDTRKSPLTSPPGTLTRLTNAVITPGGEIAKRRAFVEIADLTGSFGLAATATKLWVFGRNVAPPTPDVSASGVTLHGLTVPNSDVNLAQTDADVFNGYVYLTCALQPPLSAPTPPATETDEERKTRTQANNPHYYVDVPEDSAIDPTDMLETEGSAKGYHIRTYQSKVYAVSGKFLNFSAINDPFVWEDPPLTPVHIIDLSTGNPAVATVAEADIDKFANDQLVTVQYAVGTGYTEANGTWRISSVGDPANTFTLAEVDTSTATTAYLPASTTTTTGYTQPAVDATVVVGVAAISAGYNGNVQVSVATGGTYLITGINSLNLTLRNLGLAGSAAPGVIIATAQAVTSVTGSASVTPLSSAVGNGFINLSTQDASGENLIGLEVYYDKLGLFTSQATQIWAIDPDPAQNAFEQLLRGAGITAPRSPLQYGAGDVLYLDTSGIRSVKARDSSNSAAVSDIGSPIDPVIQALRDDHDRDYIDAAISLLEPSVGRFWMLFPDQVMVLSYFPGPQITAWSTFTLPFTVAHAVTCNGKVFIRGTDDKLYVYGGPDGKAYDNCHVEVRMPYLDGKKPGHKKQFSALDATVSGTWRIAISYDFNSPDAEETVATITYPTGGGTWNSGSHELTGYDSHFSVRLYNDDALPATISNVAVHYEPGAFEE